MTHAAEMLDLYPHDLDGIDRTALTRCIEECFSCAQVCTACADSCLSESVVADLVACIRTDLDCAEICDTTGRVLTRHTGGRTAPTRPLLEACATACMACREECLRHAGAHEHCEVCAEACRRCEQACRNLLTTLA